MSKKILTLIFALALAGVFLWMVLASSSGFNFIPYMIYESISPGGGDESNFIIGFDLVIGTLIFLFAYKIINRLLS